MLATRPGRLHASRSRGAGRFVRTHHPLAVPCVRCLAPVRPRCEQHGVDNHAVVVLPFKKDEVTLTHECAAELLQLLATPERLPVYVHCLDGVTATG